MPPAMVMAPIESPNAGPGWLTGCGRSDGRDRVRDARTGPEPERVVAAGVGVGTAVAVARAAHVDDVRVVGPDVVDLDLQPLADARHLVGEEDVGDAPRAGRGCRGPRRW